MNGENSTKGPESKPSKAFANTDGSLSPEELGAVAGGRIVRRGGDPCEGGEIVMPATLSLS